MPTKIDKQQQKSQNIQRDIERERERGGENVTQRKKKQTSRTIKKGFFYVRTKCDLGNANCIYTFCFLTIINVIKMYLHSLSW